MRKSKNNLGFKVLGRKIVVESPLNNFDSSLILEGDTRRKMAEEQIEKLNKIEVLQVGEAIDHIKVGDFVAIKQMNRGRYEIMEVPNKPESNNEMLSSVIETEENKEKSKMNTYFVFDEMDVLAIYE